MRKRKITKKRWYGEAHVIIKNSNSIQYLALKPLWAEFGFFFAYIFTISATWISFSCFRCVVFISFCCIRISYLCKRYVYILQQNLLKYNKIDPIPLKPKDTLFRSHMQSIYFVLCLLKLNRNIKEQQFATVLSDESCWYIAANHWQKFNSFFFIRLPKWKQVFHFLYGKIAD